MTASVLPSGTNGTRPADLAALTRLVSAAGVTASSGPFPVAFATLRAHGHAVPVQAQGRDVAPAAVDQPFVTQGTWVRGAGGVVLERTFAQAAGVTAGSTVTLDGRPFRVVGLAVTAAVPEYPGVCYYMTCNSPAGQAEESGMGLAWLTAASARSLATSASPLSYVLNLRLRDPQTATTFADAHGPVAVTGPESGAAVLTWQQIQYADNDLVSVAQQVLTPGSWIVIALAVTSVAVLAGGRMAEQTRRVGRLKAAGGGPSLIAAILLAEHLLIALVAAAAGLGIGRLTAPALSDAGAGLVGSPGTPALSFTTGGLVVAVALGVTLAATLVPAVRAAHTSTVRALADSARLPRRRVLLLAVSAWLPVPLLIGLRLIARRQRRAVLGTASTAITVMGVVAVMAAHRDADVATARFHWFAGLPDPVSGRVSHVMAVLTVALVVLAAVNVIITGWATAVDARQPSALSRALGGTRGQVSAGLAVAQVLPALPGAVLGMPLGVLLFAVANGTGQVLVPPAPWLAGLLCGTLAAVASLTFIPSWLAAHTGVSAALQAEAA